MSKPPTFAGKLRPRRLNAAAAAELLLGAIVVFFFFTEWSARIAGQSARSESAKPHLPRQATLLRRRGWQTAGTVCVIGPLRINKDALLRPVAHRAVVHGRARGVQQVAAPAQTRTVTTTPAVTYIHTANNVHNRCQVMASRLAWSRVRCRWLVLRVIRRLGIRIAQRIDREQIIMMP